MQAWTLHPEIQHYRVVPSFYQNVQQSPPRSQAMSQNHRTIFSTAEPAVGSSSLGSHTILQTDSHPPNAQSPSATLRLRVEPQEAARVRWAENVVDNEGMGKKSSKVCCIYHKPHEPGDSESDASSSSSDSDSEPDLSKARKAGDTKERQNGPRGKNPAHERSKGKQRRPSPNAYERQPKHNAK